MPTAMMNYRRHSRANRTILVFITLLNGAFTVISLACAALIFLNYARLPIIPEGQWMPFDSTAGSPHGSREDLVLRAVAVNEIRSAQKKGRRNPLLVATGLFVVAGVLVISLIWMFINDRLELSQKMRQQRAIALRRFGWNVGDNHGADNEGGGIQGAQNEAGPGHQGQTQGIVDPVGQTQGIQNRGDQSEGDLTLAEPLAERDLEAQYHVEHALIYDGDGRMKPPEGQQQDEENPSESTVTMRN
ncbi:hypothetical protein V8C37DRAFT_369188 [Trichoderma ceciliae]